MANQKLEKLRVILGEISDLRATISLLEWDMEVMMPPKAAEGRGMQLATLSAMLHRMTTSAELEKLLRELAQEEIGERDRLLVEETLYDFERASKLPEALVKELAEAQSTAYAAWTQARAGNNFEAFRPHLEHMVDLQRRVAEAYGYKGSPYNALIESFERSMDVETLRPLFAKLAEKQTDLVRRIVNSGRKPDLAWMNGQWDIDAQRRLSLRAMQAMGFDIEAGRLDTAPHPFCSQPGPQDVRMTTRYFADAPFSALYSTMHECGHGLYDQGMIPEYRRTTLADAPSLGIHECNSRMWENMIGRSRAFWKFFYPIAREHFPEKLRDVTDEQIYRAMNHVAPSLIRVESDECTYNLHIIIRFELEVDLIEGRLEARDVPAAWNRKYHEYLGVDVPDDAHGCLQDVHWSHGAFGYFPTYTLGNLYAAQVFEQIEKDLPNIWEDVSRGNLLTLREWLRAKIHVVGRLKTAPEVIRDITGRAPDSQPYLDYLERKFGVLYGV